jgi:hypothetical protein
MTPTPSLGKNVSGGTSRHFPSAIHEASIGLSLLIPSKTIVDMRIECKPTARFVRSFTSREALLVVPGVRRAFERALCDDLVVAHQDG